MMRSPKPSFVVNRFNRREMPGWLPIALMVVVWTAGLMVLAEVVR